VLNLELHTVNIVQTIDKPHEVLHASSRLVCGKEKNTVIFHTCCVCFIKI